MFCLLDGFILTHIDHIRLHRIIFFIINKMSRHTYQLVILIDIKRLFHLTRLHQKQHFVIAGKMIQMCLTDFFGNFHIKSRKPGKPPDNFLLRKIFFTVFIHLSPYFIVKTDMFRRKLQIPDLQGAPDKNIIALPGPVTGTKQNRRHLVSVRISCDLFQKGVDIVFHIYFFLPFDFSDLSYVIWQLHVLCSFFCSIGFFFIDDFDHTLHPF